MAGYDVAEYDIGIYDNELTTSYYVSINGVEVNRIKVCNTSNNLTKLSGNFDLTVSDPLNSLYNTISSGDEIQIFRTIDDLKIFGGYIETIDRSKEKKYELEIKGGDYTTRLNQIKMRAQVYNDREYSVIIRDMVHKYINKGTTVDAFDATTGWSSDGTVLDTISFEDGEEDGHLIGRLGDGCVKVIIDSAGTGELEKTYGNGYDLKVDSRVQLYFYIEDADSIGEIKLNVGQDSSNYFEMINEATVQDGWNYLIFDMANSTETGTTQLGNNPFFKLIMEINDTNSPFIYLDEMRINPNGNQRIKTDNVVFTNYYTTLNFKNVSIHEGIKKIANERPLDLDFYVDNSRTLNFKEMGINDSGVTLERGINLIKSNFYDDDTNLINNVTVYGARQLFTQEEKFNGDGTTRQFILEYEPVDTYVTVGGVQKKGYQSGMTGTAYDYTTDQKNRMVKFETTSIPGVGTNNIVISYSYSVPVTAKKRDIDSINKYNEREKKIENEFLTTKEDVLTVAIETVNKFKDPIKVGDAEIKTNPLIDVGEYVTVIDPDYFTTPRQFTVTNVSNTFIGGKLKTKLKLSALVNTVEDYLNNLYERLNALEEKEKGQADLLTEPIDFSDDLQVIDNPTNQLVIRLKSVAGNSLIWDNNAFGNWDEYNWAQQTGIWGNPTLGVWETAEWGAGITTTFILGNSILGRLGISPLGETPNVFSGNVVENASD